MKHISSIIGFLALASGALVTSSCEDTDSHYGHNSYGQYGRPSYDDHSRYAHDPRYQDGEYSRSDRYADHDDYDRDTDRRTSITIPVPAY
ncbi:MAG TPA: hypothetical protein VGD78_02440 [Chthoniobacterales bacterium]